MDIREPGGMVNKDGHDLIPVMGWTASHLSNQSCNICFQLVNRHNFTRSGGNKSIRGSVVRFGAPGAPGCFAIEARGTHRNWALCQSPGNDPTASEQLHPLRGAVIELVMEFQELSSDIVNLPVLFILNDVRQIGVWSRSIQIK